MQASKSAYQSIRSNKFHHRTNRDRIFEKYKKIKAAVFRKKSSKLIFSVPFRVYKSCQKTPLNIAWGHFNNLRALRMKKQLFVFLLFFSCVTKLQAWDEKVFNHEGQAYSFLVTCKDYGMSSEFEIQSGHVPPGRIKKSIFRVRSNYDLADEHGWQATGITRFFSLGSLFHWARQIDVYNTDWQYIGNISGTVLTTASACYSFYDEEDKCVGHAYVDKQCRGVSIHHPEMESRIIAQLKRHFEIGVKDEWETFVYEPSQIDFRILRIFSAFICDLQSKFKEDL